MFSIPWLISNIRLHKCKKGWKQTSLEGKPHKTVLFFFANLQAGPKTAFKASSLT